MNGTLDIVTRRIAGATIIPAKALFTRNGKPTVHLVEDDGYRTVEVEILARNSDEIAVKGVESDARVTLVDPLAEGTGDEAESGPAGNVK
jgi:hypothetical protein